MEYLEKLIPERCPMLSDSERTIFHYSGKRDLVKHLRQIHEEQRAAGHNIKASPLMRLEDGV